MRRVRTTGDATGRAGPGGTSRPEADIENVTGSGPAGRSTATAQGGGGTAEALLRLQRGAGNQVVQRVLERSATYKPKGAGDAALKALDDQVANAEADALRNLQQPPNGKHTAHQATYLLRPRPMHWGYCVEEVLDVTARAQGWSTQFALPGCRPDYHKRIAGADVFADLTTAQQSIPGGRHITGKLRLPHLRGADAAAWQAADLVHSGQLPGHAAPPQLRANGFVSDRHKEAYEAYADQLDDQTSYGPAMAKVQSRFGKVSAATFTQKWKASQRTTFANAVLKAITQDRQTVPAAGPPRTGPGRRARNKPAPRHRPY